MILYLRATTDDAFKNTTTTNLTPAKHLLGQRKVRGGSILKSIVGRGPKVQDH